MVTARGISLKEGQNQVLAPKLELLALLHGCKHFAFVFVLNNNNIIIINEQRTFSIASFSEPTEAFQLLADKQHDKFWPKELMFGEVISNFKVESSHGKHQLALSISVATSTFVTYIKLTCNLYCTQRRQAEQIFLVYCLKLNNSKMVTACQRMQGQHSLEIM